ncbi:MAG: glycosyltransferase [Candidatus Marinimicrobia bacterium]|nr:glycosyltransferase [Candidatus Neomarinimicrobiota bacterium]
MKNKTIIYAIIDWGLGHVTRSMPIIRRLINDGNKIILVSHGKALSMLKEEFPDCIIRDVKDIQIAYPKFGWMFVFKMVFQLPKMLWAWRHERRQVKALEKEFNSDLLITEMRLGFWSKKTPSILITHQLRFHLPKHLAMFMIFGEWFNRIVFRKFNYIFVPDAEGSPNLSGDLSHNSSIAKHPKVRYIGCLSSVVPDEDPPEKDIDILISISGPEPQRTQFEENVLTQLNDVQGKVVVTLGKPVTENNIVKQTENITVYSHLNRKEMGQMMQRAKHMVCRSGYSTVMELLALQKSALYVPTPGQTEQEYLAEYYKKEGLYSYCTQDKLDLKDLKIDTSREIAKRHIPLNQLDQIIELLDSLCT